MTIIDRILSMFVLDKPKDDGEVVSCNCESDHQEDSAQNAPRRAILYGNYCAGESPLDYLTWDDCKKTNGSDWAYPSNIRN